MPRRRSGPLTFRPFSASLSSNLASVAAALGELAASFSLGSSSAPVSALWGETMDPTALAMVALALAMAESAPDAR